MVQRKDKKDFEEKETFVEGSLYCRGKFIVIYLVMDFAENVILRRYFVMTIWDVIYGDLDIYESKGMETWKKYFTNQNDFSKKMRMFF